MQSTARIEAHGMQDWQKPAAKPFQPMARLRSFTYALQGVKAFVQTQHNAWLHALATLLAVTAGWFCEISRPDWIWIVAAITAVWAAEAMNTALEFLADALHPSFHPLVGKAKDVAAGAVLITASGAVIIGVITFAPYLM
jgi:diacylglycerol kinase